jgi:hypothetical protein
MGWLIWAGAAVVVVVAVVRLASHRSRQRALMLVCRRAGVSFMPVDPFPDTLWMPFTWLGEGRWILAQNLVWNAADGESARAFDLTTEQPPTNEDAQPIHHRFTCATVQLPFGCPRLEIRPREVLDDVAAAITGDDITFELEEFNRRFLVRSDDRRFAIAFCDQRMMRALLAVPHGVTIAVNEDRMLLRAPILPPAEVLLLLEAARALGRRVPPVVASLYPPRPLKGPHEDRWMQGHWSAEPIGDGEA